MNRVKFLNKFRTGQTLTQKPFDWDKIRNLFLWQTHLPDRAYCISINLDGHFDFFGIKRNSKTAQGFHGLWEKWSDALTKHRKVTQFEYPSWCLSRTRSYWTRAFMLATPSTLFMIALTWFLCARSDLAVPLTASIASLWLLPFLLRLGAWYRHPKGFSRIWITETGFKVDFVDGKTREFLIEDVKQHFLDVTSLNARIIFNDGTRLFYLQCVSYWPILRQYLLSRLERRKRQSSR